MFSTSTPKLKGMPELQRPTGCLIFKDTPTSHSLSRAKKNFSDKNWRVFRASVDADLAFDIDGDCYPYVLLTLRFLLVIQIFFKLKKVN